MKHTLKFNCKYCSNRSLRWHSVYHTKDNAKRRRVYCRTCKRAYTHREKPFLYRKYSDEVVEMLLLYGNKQKPPYYVARYDHRKGSFRNCYSTRDVMRIVNNKYGKNAV